MAKQRSLMRGESRIVNSGFAFVTGDLAILRAVYEFRFLRREHLSVLTGRDPKRVHRRLAKLVDHGMLTVTRLPQQKHIYSIGRSALPVLVTQGIISGNVSAQRLRASELKELFLKHEMLIVDHHVFLILAGKTSRLRLVQWKEGKELFDSVVVRGSEGGKKLPVRPDAFFTLEDNRRDEEWNRFSFFLEIDRSTMPHKSFKEKILAYWHYREQGLHAKKWRIKGFRVLTVTLTDARARNLRDLAATILPERARKHFLFTSADNYGLSDPGPILRAIWLSAREGGQEGRHPLIAEPE
jgi:hypothetical protein